MKRPLIAIIDDDDNVRTSLATILSTYNYSTQGFASAAAFFESGETQAFAAALLDVNMPGMDGMQALRQIKQTQPELPIILVTGYGSVPLAVKALKDGATDFIEKPINDTQLHQAIQHALAARHQDETDGRERLQLQERYQKLTPRERIILQLVGQGHTSLSIAANLDIAKKTVDHHRASIAAKMGATSVSQLVRFHFLLGEKP